MKKQIALFYLIFLIGTIHSQDVTVNTNYAFFKVVVISAQQAWTDTGIDLVSGENISIFIDGIASHGAGTNLENIQTMGWTGSEGWGGMTNSSYPAPSLAAFSIIGKITSSGLPFYVGTAISYQVKKSGRLYLGFNDNNFSNNFGYYTSFIISSKSVTRIHEIVETIPVNFQLFQNYPNPFNPTTTIKYELPQNSFVSLKVYDILGKEVANLENENKNAGRYEVKLEGSNLTSGVYFYQIRAGSFVETKKLLLMK